MSGPAVPGEIAGERAGDFILYRTPGEPPFRIRAGQSVPLISNNDPEHLRPQLVFDGHARMFIMSNAEDAASYAKIADGVAKGDIALVREEITWSDKHQSYVVFARWHEAYRELPPALQGSGVRRV
jgi:hypothetical protein